MSQLQTDDWGFVRKYIRKEWKHFSQWIIGDLVACFYGIQQLELFYKKKFRDKLVDHQLPIGGTAVTIVAAADRRLSFFVGTEIKATVCKF